MSNVACTLKRLTFGCNISIVNTRQFAKLFVRPVASAAYDVVFLQDGLFAVDYLTCDEVTDIVVDTCC